MTETPQPAPTRERVAISSRFFPLASYAIAAFGGAIGSIYMLQSASLLRDLENQGIGGFGHSIASAGWIVNIGLTLALVAGFVGIVIAIVRLFMTTAKASAPAWVFMLPGLLAIVPPIATHLATKAIMDPMLNRDEPYTGTPEKLASYLTILSIASIACGVIAILASLALAFAPLNSARNKKVGSLAVLILIELAFFLVVGMMFWYAAQISRAAYGY